MTHESTRQTGRRRRPLGARLLALILVASLAFPALAAAQAGGPTDDQYGGSDTSIEQRVESGGSGLGGRVGPLPFTGFDVIAMAAVAIAVTGIGLALQRAVTREPEQL